MARPNATHRREQFGLGNSGWEPIRVGPDGILVSDVALINRYAGGKTPVTFTVSSSGDNTIVAAPGVGFRIILFWAYALTDPDESASPLITIKDETGTEYYRGYAIAHWEPFPLPENKALVVNISDNVSVSGTVHIMVEGV